MIFPFSEKDLRWKKAALIDAIDVSIDTITGVAIWWLLASIRLGKPLMQRRIDGHRVIQFNPTLSQIEVFVEDWPDSGWESYPLPVDWTEARALAALQQHFPKHDAVMVPIDILIASWYPTSKGEHHG